MRRVPAVLLAGMLFPQGVEGGQAPAVPAWVAGLPAWQWHPIPNTPLSSVEPSPRPLGWSGPASKISAWCGATLKRQGSVYLIGAAGGHADYGGNEVDALQLNAAAPQWVQLRGPSANSDMIGSSSVFLDRRGAATHTYYATQFIDARNRLIVFENPGCEGGPFPAPPGGWPYAGRQMSTSFNLATGDWDPPDYVPDYTGGGDWTACLCVKHPVTEDVYYNRYAAGWWRWTQATNTWIKLSDNNQPGNYRGAAIDPTRNRMLLVGGGGGPEVRELNGNPVSVTFGGLGASALSVGGYPGVIYDEANDSYLVVFNSGSSILVRRVQAGSWTVDQPAMSGTAPAARPNGIHNSVQYAPELGGFVIANSYAGNVYFVKTSASSPSLPAVTVAASDPDAGEAGPDPGSFTLSRTGSTGSALAVAVSVTGTASSADHGAITVPVTIPAGSSSVVVPVAPVDDAAPESAETVILTVVPGSGYAVGSPSSAAVTIADDDGPPADADGDGLPDAWEIQHFGDTASQDGGGDADRDGATNLQEYLAGSDPMDPASVPGGAAASPGSGGKEGLCGALGLEAALLAFLLGFRRRGA